MDAVHDGMYAKAKRNLDENIYDAFTLEEAKRLQQEHGGFIQHDVVRRRGLRDAA